MLQPEDVLGPDRRPRWAWSEAPWQKECEAHLGKHRRSVKIPIWLVPIISKAEVGKEKKLINPNKQPKKNNQTNNLDKQPKNDQTQNKTTTKRKTKTTNQNNNKKENNHKKTKTSSIHPPQPLAQLRLGLWHHELDLFRRFKWCQKAPGKSHRIHGTNGIFTYLPSKGCQMVPLQGVNLPSTLGFNWYPLQGAVTFIYHKFTPPPPKTNMTNWKIPIFNRKYIFIHGGFSTVMLVFGGGKFMVYKM